MINNVNELIDYLKTTAPLEIWGQYKLQIYLYTRSMEFKLHYSNNTESIAILGIPNLPLSGSKKSYLKLNEKIKCLNSTEN